MDDAYGRFRDQNNGTLYKEQIFLERFQRHNSARLYDIRALDGSSLTEKIVIFKIILYTRRDRKGLYLFYVYLNCL